MTMKKQRKLCYTDSNSLIIHLKSEHVYADFVEDFEMRFNTSNYEVDRTISMKKQKGNQIKDYLYGEAGKEFAALRPKKYSYLKDDECVGKKSKGTKNCAIKCEK